MAINYIKIIVSNNTSIMHARKVLQQNTFHVSILGLFNINKYYIIDTSVPKKRRLYSTTTC